ncbi:VWA domain-containing protein [Tropicibacter sp. R15_0]|uniref:VWA domain-containing protein n=1 Tax=Tropicibacter sp. R15_0 TaxID=2821101 RepID=UPI001ADA4B3E|nr:VWA domain-containing protein [Tropicibacter sp. R15_0]MBO9464900.1 VWA domain-containing protein [Tropicibacter sp. R15_0]
MKLRRSLWLGTFCLPFLSPLAAVAQETPSSILVLDGSGSMWGQIDGKAKITIAQEVVGDLLNTLPAETHLGLTVYGHREKGNCRDIQTVVAPGADTRSAIADAVNRIKPKGKTPLSDAVRAAAEELRYTEDKATVILVSDGRETCVADPCEVARTLEETGVDLTVHVVGFDVSDDPTALGQLQCLADETGGQFVTADNADQLSAALTTIAETPAAPPAPSPVETSFAALDGEGGSQMQSGVTWRITGPDGYRSDGTGVFTLPLLPGDYTATAIRDADEVEVSGTFTVVTDSQRVVLTLPVITPKATVTGPETAYQGQTIDVSWDGPGEQGDFISVHTVNGDVWAINSADIAKGNPVKLRMPAQPGTYELRYQVKRNREVIARTPITILASDISFDAPGQAEIGSSIKIDWIGPANQGDFISVHKVGGDVWAINSVDTAEGSPVTLRMPGEPGPYELRYQLAEDRAVIYTQPIEVTDALITLTHPAEAQIGTVIEVDWKGPANPGDFISVHKPGGDVWAINSADTAQGSPVKLRMPSEPGPYEIRYQLAEDRKVVFTQPIDITAATVSLDFPEQAEIGQVIDITWSGPANQGDFISVKEVGGDVWGINSRDTAEGSPLKLRMPHKPGDYEIRYQLAEEREIILRKPIKIVQAEVAITVPAQAEIGETIDVTWSGPGNQGDFISVKEAGGDVWGINSRDVAEGSPLKLRMPHKPGDYEIRYQLAEERGIIHRVPITIVDAQVSITVPAQAEIGQTIDVTWDGPGNQGDFLSVKEAGGDVWGINSRDVGEGSPLKLRMPHKPGDYEIRYQLAEERGIIHRVPITIIGTHVDLQAPGDAKAGQNALIAWEGPGNQGDFISIKEVGGDEWGIHSSAVNDGGPISLRMPDQPGQYELRYQLGEERAVIHRVPITVNP